MRVINARNVNEAYALAMNSICDGWGVTPQVSRNGPVLEFSEPVTTVYRKPSERVLFDAARDCNPFLHFFESLWMLAGRNDLAFLSQFTKNMVNFSDDGETLNGAYGHRWRHHFRKKSANALHEEVDQLELAVEELKSNPHSRRVVIQMWDGTENQESKDIPCNTSVMWRLRDGVLDMTVTNRSNDMIWGCYGANAVHFSFLHEYVAASVGVEVGRYYQVSNSLHCYPELDVAKRCLASPPDLSGNDFYNLGWVEPFPLFSGGASQIDFDSDLFMFFLAYDSCDSDLHAEHFRTQFFTNVVAPMWETHRTHKARLDAWRESEYICATDWQRAAQEWLQRRGFGA